jgi:hypothetical protein
VNVKPGNAEISVSNGKISCDSWNCSIISENNQITLSAGGASITLSSSGIQLSCGSSTIDLSSSNISLNSTSIVQVQKDMRRNEYAEKRDKTRINCMF